MPSSIKPFQATYYNEGKAGDISTAVCPPYDVISPAQLKQLQESSPYNFSNVLIDPNSDYTQIGKKFRAWLSNEVLVDDPTDSLYLYEQKFVCNNKIYKRFGVLSLLSMDKKGIFPHEYTLSKPKEDRKRIIKELQANLSPIFVVVPKKLKTLNALYKKYSRKKAFYSFKDFQGDTNNLWKISDPKDIAGLCAEIDKNKLVIADGHHRFEISYDYYQNNKGKFKDLNYLLAFVTDQQPGLLILPTHRVANLSISLTDAVARLSADFTIKQVTQGQIEKLLAKQSKVFSFGLVADNKFYYCSLKKPASLNAIKDIKIYRKLDTYLLHQFVFDKLGFKGPVEYTHDFNEAVNMSVNGKTGFLLRSTNLKEVFDIANKGFRLPQKSTYFYPKLLSGLVIRRFKSA